MTRKEAEAAERVLTWIFTTPRWNDPAKLRQACLLLAAGVAKHGGSWTPERVKQQPW